MRDMGFIAKFKSAIILMAGAVGIAGTAGAVGFSALSEGGAGQKPEKTDAEGHVLVKLWKTVDRAVGEDRPQAALSSLEKVISEAKSRHLAWDYCDAWIQYRTIAVRRDWKQNDPLSRRMAEEALEFGDPLVAYCLNYSQISDVDSVLRFAEAQAPVLKASRSAAFYSRGSAQKMSLYGYSSLPDFVISGMSNDYEYVMWSLLSGLGYGSDDWNRVRSVLAEYLGDAYPSGAYLELLGVRHFDYDRAAKAPEAGGADAAALKKKRLVEFASKYEGKAIALYARQDLLMIRFNECNDLLYGIPGSRSLLTPEDTEGGDGSCDPGQEREELSEMYRVLRADCAAFESWRASFRGAEKIVAEGCAEVASLMKTLDAKEISHEWSGDTVKVKLRNLDKATFRLVKDRETVFETPLVNEVGSFYVPDTLNVSLPAVDDGDYTIVIFSGKVTDAADYRWRSVSAAYRYAGPGSVSGAGLGVFAADAVTGEPLRNAAIEVYDRGRLVHSVKDIDFAGYERLERDLAAEYGDSLYRLRLRCSAADESGRFVRSQDINFGWAAPDVSPASTSGILCSVYLDRLAFSPGDTVRFKGVFCTEGREDADAACVAGADVAVRLLDPDGNVVEVCRLRTNDFGSTAGSFALPSDGKNGMYRIEAAVDGAASGSGAAYLRVDDFVLPTFSLSFDPLEDVVFPGDSVKITGKITSYSGHSLAGASVSYSVTEYSDIVASGFPAVDSDGRFSFAFKAGDRSDSYGYYQVKVTVTDATGETCELSQSVIASYALSLSVVPADAADGLVTRTGLMRGESLVKSDVAQWSFSLRNAWSRTVRGCEIVYSVTRDGETVSSGTASPDEIVSLDLSGMPSGEYILEAECSMSYVSAEGRDSSVTAKCSHSFFKISEADGKLGTEVESVFKVIDSEDDIALLVGASDGPVWVSVELWGMDSRLLRSELVHLDGKRGADGSLRVLRYGFREDYPDKVRLEALYFRDGRTCRFSHVYERQEKKSLMPLEFSSFVDRTSPGQECTFEVKALPETEVLASVFDRSTEDIMPNEWRRIVFPEEMRVPTVYIGTSDGSVGGDGRRFSYGGHYLLSEPVNGIASEESASADGATLGRVVYDKAEAVMSKSDDLAAASPSPAAAGGSEVSVRSDFANTLTFQPFLRTSPDGTVSFSFRASDKASTYWVSLFAHDKSMRNGVLRREMLVSRDVLVSVMEPQFLHEGDRYVMRASVSNISDSDVEGMLTVSVYEGSEHEGRTPVVVMSRPLAVSKGGAEMERFEVDVPEHVDSLGFKIVFSGAKASAGSKDASAEAEVPEVKYSDGVFVSVPVKPSVQTVEEAHSAVLLPGMDRDSLLADLRGRFVNVSGYGAETSECSLTDMVMAALPEKVGIDGKDVISLVRALYSVCLSAELRSGGESDAARVEACRDGKPVGGAFELAALLADYVNADGGFAWFSGMDSSPIVTAVVLEYVAAMLDRGILDTSLLPNGVIGGAVAYLDSAVVTENAFGLHFAGLSLSQYLHVRTMYPSVPLNLSLGRSAEADFRRQVKKCLDVKGKEALEGMILGKARRLSVLMNLTASDGRLAKELGLSASSLKRLERNVGRDMASLMEYAVAHGSGGRYFPNAVMPFRGLLESELYAHALLCRLLSEYAESSGSAEAAEIADGVRVWMMVQKETQNWSDDPAFVEAVASVADGLASVGDVSVVALRQRVEKPFDAILPSGNGIGLTAKWYVERVVDVEAASGSKMSLVPLHEGDSLSVGDKIMAVYEIHSDENRSFVKATLPRNASLRPVNQLSGHLYGALWRYAVSGDGVPASVCLTTSVYPAHGYREVKTDRTEYFLEVCPEETSCIREQLIVTQEGVFTSPVSEIECLYAPHYRANGAFDGQMRVE